MPAQAYALASVIYPLLLAGTMLVGLLGIAVNRGGSRRVGSVMIGCQLFLLSLATFVHWPAYQLESMVIINGLAAVPLLLTPPSPPYRLQRIAAGMFLASAMLNAIFALFTRTPSVVALYWFSSAAIDAMMIVLLGGWCSGIVAGGVADWLRRHVAHTPFTGDHR